MQLFCDRTEIRRYISASIAWLQGYWWLRDAVNAIAQIPKFQAIFTLVVILQDAYVNSQLHSAGS